MSIKTRRYLAFKRLEEDEALFLSTTPFYWEVSGHGDKYRYTVGLSLLTFNINLRYIPTIGLASPNRRKGFLKPILHSA